MSDNFIGLLLLTLAIIVIDMLLSLTNFLCYQINKVFFYGQLMIIFISKLIGHLFNEKAGVVMQFAQPLI